MNATEITALLTVCASFDGRKPNPDTVPAWLAALGDLDFTPARDAVVAHYQESREWIMPADVRGRVRRARAEAIRTDEALELPPHDPDNTAAHIAALKAARSAAAEGRPFEASGLVRRSEFRQRVLVRSLRTFDVGAKAANKDALAELAAAPEPEPEPAPTFVCEHLTDSTPCGRPAPHLSADRRRPVCGEHVDLDPTEESA